MDIRFLLFSSMLKPTELYLSKEAKNKAVAKKNTFKGLKLCISKAIDKKLRLSSKNGFKEQSLDYEVEEAVKDLKHIERESFIVGSSTEEKGVDNGPKVIKYGTKDAFKEIKAAFKDLYKAFVGYAKSSYAKTSSGGKKVDGFVKMSIYKLLKIGEYVMALTTPQWNKVTGSPEDLDTYAMTVTHKDSVDEENLKYEIGISVLEYRA
jgi:hypothetical protein